MASILTGLQDLISNPFGTPVGQLIEKATSSDESSENWAMYMEICDIINETDEGPKDAVRAIRKQIANNAGKNNAIVLCTITVLETCVKNCNCRFHIQIGQREFVQELVKVAMTTQKSNTSLVVTDRILNLLQSWADAFQGIEEMKEIGRAVQELKEKGIEFPMTDLDLIAPIHTPARSTDAPSRPPPQLKPRQPKPNLSSTEKIRGSDMSFHVPAPPKSPIPASVPITSLTNQQMSKLRLDLDLVSRNCSVLSDLLSELTPGQETSEDWTLLQDLNRSCRQMQQRIMTLIQQVQVEQVTDELLNVNDQANNVLLRYDRFERLHYAGAGGMGGGAARDDDEEEDSRRQSASLPPSYSFSRSTTNGIYKPSDPPLYSSAGATASVRKPVVPATAQLVDLGDSPSPAPRTQVTPSPAPRAPVTAESVAILLGSKGTRSNTTRSESDTKSSKVMTTTADDTEFDMFAQSREAYKESQQRVITDGSDAYSRQPEDDEMMSGLGSAVALKSKLNPYSTSDSDDKANTLLFASREAQQPAAPAVQTTATSSEFDQFLAACGTDSHSSSNNTLAVGAPSIQKTNRGGRTLQKTDTDDSMFSL